MKSKKLLAAVVAAITMLAGGLGMALWPSSAGAIGSIRKFSGILNPGSNTVMLVLIHNPHPTATFKPTVIVRDFSGREMSRTDLSVGPNAGTLVEPFCPGACSVEVNMTNAILQPSIHYFSQVAQQHEFVYPGDFSR